MDDLPREVHRTLNTDPSEYEQALSKTLFGILSKSIHDLPGIVSALNESEVRPPDSGAWTEEIFAAEMERLGAYPNSAGAPLGEHPAGAVPPGTSITDRPGPGSHGGD